MKHFSFTLPRLATADWLIGLPLIVAGLLFRLLQLGCYEFKDDQARTALNALCALRDGLLIAHGQPGSTGIPNPPGAPILLAIPAVFGTGSLTFAITFTLLSLLTVVLAWLLLRRVVPERTAWYVAILLAASPQLIWHSSNVWGPTLLPLHVLIMIFCLLRYRNGGSPWYWVAAGLSAGIAAWAWHLSAIFLLPSLLITARRRCPALRFWVILAILGLALFVPWFWFLAFIWEPEITPMPSPWWDKLLAWIVEPGRMGTLFFFDEYTPARSLVYRVASLLHLPLWLTGGLFALSCLPLWCGLIAAIDKCRRDALVRLAFALILPVVICYLLLCLRLHQHYLAVIYPALLTAAATGLTQLPERTARQLILAGTVPALMVTLALQLSFCRAGGDWYEFGPSGNFLEAAAAELDTCSPGTPLNVTIVPGSPAADKKLDDIAVNFIFWRHQVPDGLPVKLVIDWRDGRFVREIQLP